MDLLVDKLLIFYIILSLFLITQTTLLLLQFPIYNE